MQFWVLHDVDLPEGAEESMDPDWPDDWFYEAEEFLGSEDVRLAIEEKFSEWGPDPDAEIGHLDVFHVYKRWLVSGRLWGHHERVRWRIEADSAKEAKEAIAEMMLPVEVTDLRAMHRPTWEAMTG